jgi:hypothetical protein
VGARSRPFGAADDHHGLERPELHGNFSLTAAAAGSRPPSPLRQLKIAYENRSSYRDGRASRYDRTTMSNRRQ